MGERTADTRGGQAPDRPRRTGADLLRYIPPVAALGTAFVLQTIAVADTVGQALADRFATTWMYLPAVLLGLSVASCAEGGAAYLLDLYDKHLLARDSVWLLRAAMAGYVAVSAAAIHWWTDHRGLPVITSWLLAGMSASALFLWSRGSRWRNRQAMLAAGQIDPALPRLPIAAKVLHPVRWLVTLYLISWRPVATTEDARGRYEQWRDARGGKTARTERYVRSLVEAAEADIAAMRAAAEADAERVRAQAKRALAEAVRAGDNAARATGAGSAQPDSAAPARPAVRLVASNPGRSPVRRAAGDVSVEQLADTLDERFTDTVPGRPTARTYLRGVYGTCSTERAQEAVRLLSARRAATGPDDNEDEEATG